MNISLLKTSFSLRSISFEQKNRHSFKIPLGAVCFFVFNSFFINAQNFSYSFAKDSSQYNSIANPYVLSSNESWVNKNFGLHLPFQFNFCGSHTDSINIETNGFLVFDIANQFAIVAFNNFGCKKDTNQNYTASIGYVIEGAEGNRIVKIEYKNLAQGILSNYDYLNYEIWLYENGNKIEYHIGANSYSNESGEGIAALIGIINRNMDTENKAYLVTGNPSIPAVQIVSGENELLYLSNIPYSGTIYTLTPTFN